VRRLHKLKEASAVRGEWEVLSPNGNGEPRSVFAWIAGTNSGGVDERVLDQKAKEKQEAEHRIAERLRVVDKPAANLFLCLCEGVVKRREIASRLGISVSAVTNCRKRLKRKLEALGIKGAGVPE
jgi:hypothetical protein